MSDCILVFCRVPGLEPGKTRLAQSIGPRLAADWYQACLLDTLDSALTSPAERVIACCSPPAGETVLREWMSSHGVDGERLSTRAQHEGDLGRRMAASIRQALAEGYSKVLLIGSDLPGLPGRPLEEGFRELDRVDLVFGPSPDGGFYLVGTGRDAGLEELFQGIRWSCGDTLLQVLGRARTRGMATHLLEMWPDLDTLEDVPAVLQCLRIYRESGRAVGTRLLALLEDEIWQQGNQATRC